MSSLKTFLKEFNLSDAEIEALQAETPPDNFDAKSLANEKRSHIIEVDNAANPRITEETVQGKIIQAQKDLKFKVAKELGFTQTRGELEKMPIDEFTALVKATNESLTSKITGDEKLKSDLAEFREKYLKTNQELENERATKDADIAKTKAEALKEVQIFKRKALIEKESNTFDLPIPKEAKDAVIAVFEQKIDRMPWTIGDNGELTGEGGTGLAIDFDKKGSFKTLREAMAKEFEPLLRKSNGTGGAGDVPIVVAGVDVGKITTGTNKETLDRLMKFDDQK
jgi:hypothetical protein